MPYRLESVIDFSHRSIHATAQVGKRIATLYYHSEPHHSYYDGCSAGGRQGISIASRYPDDFDGIIAGAPAIDWENLAGAPTIWASHVAVNTSSYIPKDVWETVVAPEVLKQCDGLDGRIDGMIADPDACKFDPTTLLCTRKATGDSSGCLIQAQVDGLKEFYKPIYGSDGDILFARFDPGAEGDMTYGLGMSGTISPLTEVRLHLTMSRRASFGLLTYPNTLDLVQVRYLRQSSTFPIRLLCEGPRIRRCGRPSRDLYVGRCSSRTRPVQTEGWKTPYISRFTGSCGSYPSNPTPRISDLGFCDHVSIDDTLRTVKAVL